MIRFVTLVALLSPVAACVTEEQPLHGIKIQPLSAHTPDDGNGYLLLNLIRCPVVMGAMCPAVTPHLRVRIDGDFLISEDGNHVLTDDVLFGGPMVSQAFSLLPAGDHLIELVTDDGSVWSTSAIHLPLLTFDEDSQLFVSGDGKHSWFHTPELVDDQGTFRSDIVNVTDTPLDIERCEFEVDGPETCTSVGTAAPFDRWQGDVPTQAQYAKVHAEIRAVVGDQKPCVADLTRPQFPQGVLVCAIVKEPSGKFHGYLGANWDF